MTSTSRNDTKWRNVPSPHLNPDMNRWLFRPAALTDGLRQLGVVNLRVVREYSEGLSADESSALQRPVHSAVWVREVAMAIDGVDCVVARSLTPLAASHGPWQGMRRLRTRPLADMLYHEAGIIRSVFWCSRADISIPIYRTAARILGNPRAQPGQTLLARRSTFWRRREPLIVAECFLPAFWDKARQVR
jgi:chorismate--pyruvate lyase